MNNWKEAVEEEEKIERGNIFYWIINNSENRKN